MAPLVLSHRQRLEFESFVSHAHLAKPRCRALALLGLDDGESAEQVAELLHVGRRTVHDWVDRFHDRAELDLPVRLADAPRPGRPRVGGDGVDRWIARGSPERAWRAAAATVAGTLVALLVSATTYGAANRVRSVVEQRTLGGRRLVRLYATLADRDGDRYPWAFGGGDCQVRSHSTVTG